MTIIRMMPIVAVGFEDLKKRIIEHLNGKNEISARLKVNLI